MTKCPQCGYNEVPEVKTYNTVMNHYIRDGKDEVILNETAERLEKTVGEGENKKVYKFVRKDVFKKEANTPTQAKEVTPKK